MIRDKKTYTTWIHHGELHPRSRVNVGAGTNNEDWFPRMVDMVNDIFGCARNEDDPESHVGGSTSICPDEANIKVLLKDKMIHQRIFGTRS